MRETLFAFVDTNVLTSTHATGVQGLVREGYVVTAKARRIESWILGQEATATNIHACTREGNA